MGDSIQRTYIDPDTREVVLAPNWLSEEIQRTKEEIAQYPAWFMEESPHA